MAKPSANLRLFVALYPPPEAVTAMLSALTSGEVVRDLPPHRLTPADQLHMTVQFIGDTPAQELDATIESVQRAAAGLQAFRLSLSRLITLPERGPARLIAAETEQHSTLAELHRRLVTRLARNVREKKRERFRPHFTLCRFRSPARGLKVDGPLQIAPFQVDRIVLMRSTLRHEGASHHEVAACALESAM